MLLPFCLVLDLQNQKPRQKLIINSVVLRRKNWLITPQILHPTNFVPLLQHSRLPNSSFLVISKSMQKHAANARVISLRSTNYYPPLKSNYYRNKIKWYAKKSPGNTGFSGFVALFRYSVKLSFAELRTLDFTELFGGLKSFRINKTLKLSALQFSFCWCLKSFRINKTLKPVIRTS